jgi:hypothetical protein
MSDNNARLVSRKVLQGIVGLGFLVAWGLDGAKASGSHSRIAGALDQAERAHEERQEHAAPSANQIYSAPEEGNFGFASRTMSLKGEGRASPTSVP